MRRYSDPIEVRRSVLGLSGDASGSTARDRSDRPAVAGADGADGADGFGGAGGAEPSGEEQVGGDTPDAFIWHGRLYVVRRVLAHWRERRSWWRDALDPVPGQPTGIDAASREQHVWRVEASRGHTYGVGVFDLTNDGAAGTDAQWRLVGVAD